MKVIIIRDKLTDSLVKSYIVHSKIKLSLEQELELSNAGYSITESPEVPLSHHDQIAFNKEISNFLD